jgi:hypothetical protein
VARHLDADPFILAGGADLVRLRSLQLKVRTPTPDRLDLLLSLRADGTLGAIVSRDGVRVPEEVAALEGTAHGATFPSGTPDLLVVRAATLCQVGACAVVIGPPPP